MYSRRKFLQVSSLGSAAVMMPGFLQNMQKPQNIQSDKKLVIIQLSGGNDGLNTCIPFTNDIYYRSRPRLALPKNNILPVSDELGFHSEMKGFRNLFDQGYLSIIHRVGYPNPDRSHFRSMDIWHTGSDATDYWETGWLGRYLDNTCSGCAKPHTIIEASDTLSLAVKGKQTKGLGIQSAKQLRRKQQNPYINHLASQYKVNDSSHTSREAVNDPPLSYLYKTLVETTSSLSYLQEHVQLRSRINNYPNSPFAQKLKLIADLILSDIQTTVFYVSLSGFDTHVRQKEIHARLLRQYSEGVSYFIQDLVAENKFDQTLIMTFSEFGRRVEQNASQGTDHGKANDVFIMGGQLSNPGFINKYPDLSELDDGDIKYQVDFRQIYATILEDWLVTDSNLILKKEFQKLALV